MLYLPNVMLRNTKHILHACLLFALFIFFSPSVNAQLPTLPFPSGLGVYGYQVQGVAAPPAHYFPGPPNTVTIWGQNFTNAPVSVLASAYRDDNNDGIYTMAELIYSSGSAMTLPPTSFNSGLNSISGLTVPIPNLPPGNVNTKIVLSDPTLPIGPYSGLAEAIVEGTSTDLTLLALVDDDPNTVIPNIPNDCPLDQMIELEGGPNGNINAVTSDRLLDIKVYDQPVSNQNIPFSVVRHVVALEPNTGAPKVLPSQLLVPAEDFFLSNQGGQQIDHDHQLIFGYWPAGYTEFEVYYFITDSDGTPIEIVNFNSQVGPAKAFQSWSVHICENSALQEPNIDPQTLQDIIDGHIELTFGNYVGGEVVIHDNEGEGGRQGMPAPSSQKEALIFPNPSAGTSYLQLELAEASEISWQILNINGQKVSASKVQGVKSGTYIVDLETQALTPGLYMLQYYLDGQLYQKRFAKQ
ncbi:MAG: T9SS type A sorting domain-containing protein [Bacteroidota bacterium]